MACTEVIEQANAIMEYDLRNGVADDICPVIRGLYKASPGHSALWSLMLLGSKTGGPRGFN